jgi:hypothetical protein
MKKLTFALIVVVTLISSCKKDKSEDTTTGIPLIKSRVMILADSTIYDSVALEYNTQNKLIGGKTKNGGNMVVEYGTSVITLKVYDKTGVLSRTETSILNSQGWISEYSIVDVPQNINDNQKYFFDDQEHLVKFVESTAKYIDTSFNSFTGDNVTTTILRSWMHSAVSIDTTYSEYYTDKLSTIETCNMGFPTIGKPNKNLLKKTTEGEDVTDYIYEFDSQNRVLKQTVYYKGKLSYHIDFTYVGN